MTSVQTSGRWTARSASPPWRLVPALAVTAVVGVLIGRFAFLAPDAEPERPVAVVNPTGQELIPALEAMTELAPGDASLWQQLGAATTTEGIRTGDVAFLVRADEALRHAEQLAPDAFATRLTRGSLDLTLHRFDDALGEGRAAVAANPFSAEALGVVVDAQVELGAYDAAAADLQRMLDLDPGLPALARTSYLRELRGDLPGALQAMQQAEAAGAPTGFQTAVVAALVGDLHLELGGLDDADAAYRRAVAADPLLPAAAIGLARVQAARGELAAAISSLDALLDRAPSPAAATLLGQLLRIDERPVESAEADRLVRALTDLQVAAGQVVDLEIALFEADAGDPARAVALAEQAEQARAGNVFVEDALGWALVRSGHAAAAIPHVEAALRRGTSRAPFHVHAAAAFAAVGDHDRAVTQLRIAFTKPPWTATGLGDEARDLASRLGIAVPEPWRAS